MAGAGIGNKSRDDLDAYVRARRGLDLQRDPSPSDSDDSIPSLSKITFDDNIVAITDPETPKRRKRRKKSKEKK
ncbi:hypothetical protein GCK32_014834, partial [Trichostrongylus colubriformis]